MEFGQYSFSFQQLCDVFGWFFGPLTSHVCAATERHEQTEALNQRNPPNAGLFLGGLSSRTNGLLLSVQRKKETSNLGTILLRAQAAQKALPTVRRFETSSARSPPLFPTPTQCVCQPCQRRNARGLLGPQTCACMFLARLKRHTSTQERQPQNLCSTTRISCP